MPDPKQKWPENAKGKFYVDQSCISCDACVTAAAGFFKIVEDGGHAIVIKQPESPEDEDKCREAMEGCPVESIGNNGDQE